MKLAFLIFEITSAFENGLVPNEEYILTEYNTLIKTLLLMLPESDGVLSATPVDGVIETSLVPAQIKRVFCKNDELLRASDSLRELLPSGRLYTPKENCIYVTAGGECIVFYRILPPDVDASSLSTADFPLDTRYIPLVRAWLWHRVYLYLGDIESANAYAEEYNRLLADYRAENGVTQ